MQASATRSIGCRARWSTLTQQVGTLTQQVGCLRTVPLSTYYGYWYDDILTDAVDVTDPGDSVGFYAAYDSCGVIPQGIAAQRLEAQRR